MQIIVLVVHLQLEMAVFDPVRHIHELQPHQNQNQN